jgi:hypothetical protein
VSGVDSKTGCRKPLRCEELQDVEAINDVVCRGAQHRKSQEILGIQVGDTDGHALEKFPKEDITTLAEDVPPSLAPRKVCEAKRHDLCLADDKFVKEKVRKYTRMGWFKSDKKVKGKRVHVDAKLSRILRPWSLTKKTQLLYI